MTQEREKKGRREGEGEKKWRRNGEDREKQDGKKG